MKRFYRSTKKTGKALDLATKRKSAEITQLGERQTDDLKVPISIPGFGKFSSIKREGGIGPHGFSTKIFDLV